MDNQNDIQSIYPLYIPVKITSCFSLGNTVSHFTIPSSGASTLQLWSVLAGRVGFPSVGKCESHFFTLAFMDSITDSMYDLDR